MVLVTGVSTTIGIFLSHQRLAGLSLGRSWGFAGACGLW